MSGFRVTYDIVSPESAANGDVSDRGYISPGGMHVNVETDEDRAAVEMSLREALNYCTPQEDCGSWFTEVDGRDDYSTGENETRSLHPPESITAASYRRLRRLFKLERTR